MSNKTNVMPNNLDAEQALLGCMLIDNEILSEVLDKLSSDDFYQESHQYILSAIKIIFNERKPVDIVTLADKLETEKNLEKAGGINYLTELAQITPSAANYEHYLDIVKRDSINRKLIRASRDVIVFAQESDDSLKSVQYAESLIYGISKTNDTSTMKDIRESDGIEKVLDKFQKLAEDKDAFRGIPTGFHRLDKITNGLQRSDLIVLAARPGMGKTSLSMNIVENAALNNNKVCAVFSLEMPETQIIQRLLCGFSGVSMADALSGNLKPNDWKKLVQSSEKMKKARIFIDDSSRVTPAEILSKCRRIKAKNNGQLDLVMVDYIQLMSSGRNSKGEENRTQEVATITRELKIMAKELDVPLIALSQLRRMQTKEPQLTDLRESGAIEQDADIVMFINRPDVGASDEEMKKNNIVKGMAELIIAKHRHGSTGRIPLRFKGEITKFVNPEPNDELQEPVYDNAPPPDDYVPVDESSIPPASPYDDEEDPF
ncbi:MAG: replicative DNA helicase [Clostridia bacterium]|nr:replicative DNA helicase [Clostridia bacterium]